MFLKGTKIPLRRFLTSSVTYCDEQENTTAVDNNNYSSDDTDGGGQSLIEQADAILKTNRSTIQTPMAFEDIGRTCSGGAPDTYDGLRLIYQKPLNLNTTTSHFWWLGSQMIQKGSMYQYRLILHDEDTGMMSVATDMDFNLQLEAKRPLTENLMFKSNANVRDEGNGIQGGLYYAGKSSNSGVEVSQQGPNSSVTMSYMQVGLHHLSLSK